MLLLMLMGCDEVSDTAGNESNIDDDISIENDIINEILITVNDSTLSPSQTYYDSFIISSPENFIDISENIVNLPFTPVHYNISVHTISVDPPVYYPKALCYTRLPHNRFWDYELLRRSWRITSSDPEPEWTAIALFGYTAENSISTDTLKLSLSINGNTVFVDSSIVINFIPLNNAIYTAIPGTDHFSESSQMIRFLRNNFKTNVAREYRDSRNIHNFVFSHRLEGNTWLSSAGASFSTAYPMEAFFFFSNLPE